MKLYDKIHNRRIVYLLKRELSIAFELALLYYIQAKRKTSQYKKHESCLKSIYWLRKAEIVIPEKSINKNPLIQLEVIERLLVLNKSRFYDWDRVAVGARIPIEVLALAGALV